MLKKFLNGAAPVTRLVCLTIQTTKANSKDFSKNLTNEMWRNNLDKLK